MLRRLRGHIYLEKAKLGVPSAVEPILKLAQTDFDKVLKLNNSNPSPELLAVFHAQFAGVRDDVLSLLRGISVPAEVSARLDFIDNGRRLDSAVRRRSQMRRPN